MAPSMEYDDEDQEDMAIPAMPEKPQFPYGLRISLSEKEIDKCECDPEDVKVGDLIHLTEVFARVTSVNHNDGEGGKTSRWELQIEHLNIEDETLED